MISTIHSPAETQIVFRNCTQIPRVFQAVANVDQSTPLVKNAIGCSRMSWVGVIADRASMSNGPMPATIRTTKTIP
jgi:hypothetical protein